MEEERPKLRFIIKNEQELQQDAQQQSQHLTKKDAFVMSFLAFLLGGVILTISFLVTESITGDAVLDLAGEEEGDDISEIIAVEAPVVAEETATAAEAVETPAMEEPVVEEVVEETVPENVTEEVVAEEEDDSTVNCGEDVTLTFDTSARYNGKLITLKLADSSAAQLSVGGKPQLISVGETSEINGLDITLKDSSSDTVVFTIAC